MTIIINAKAAIGGCDNERANFSAIFVFLKHYNVNINSITKQNQNFTYMICGIIAATIL